MKLERNLTNIEVRRAAFNSNFDMLRLNFAVELLGMNIWGKIYVNVNLL